MRRSNGSPGFREVLLHQCWKLHSQVRPSRATVVEKKKQEEDVDVDCDCSADKTRTS